MKKLLLLNIFFLNAICISAQDVDIVNSDSSGYVLLSTYEMAYGSKYKDLEKSLIKETKAEGVIFISGDVHYSEISKIETESYPIYDFTSSGLSSSWKFATPNKNRIEGPVMENHFGLITIKGNNNTTGICLETWDIKDNQRIEYSFGLKDIRNQSK